MLGFIFRAKIFADTSGYPSWFDSQFINNMTSVWSPQQTLPLKTCLSTGTVTKVALNAVELQRYGAKAQAYEARTNDTANTSKIRLIVYQGATLNGVVRIGVALGNAGTQALTLDNASAIYKFYWIPSNNPSGLVEGQTIMNSSYAGVYSFNNLTTLTGNTYATPVSLTINPGEYREAGPFQVDAGTSPIYSKISFSEKNPNNTEESFCVAEPLKTSEVPSFTAQKTYSNWMDSKVVQKALNTWTAAQTSNLNVCTQNNYVAIKQQPNSSEITNFGTNVRVFDVASSHYYDPGWGGSSDNYMRTKYRIAIAPIKYTDNGTGGKTAQFKLGLGNPNPVAIPVKLANLDIVFPGIPTTDQTLSSTAGRYTAQFNGGSPMTLQPSQYTEVTTGTFTVKNEAIYSTFDFGTASYGKTNGVINWSDGGSASHISCIAEPFSIEEFTAIQPVPTPTPSATLTTTATATKTATVAPSPIPSPTSTGLPNVSYTFRKGFSVYGATTPLSADLFKQGGVYLYKFDGVSNSWVMWPGGTNFTTEAGRGYYVYSSPDPKSFFLPFSSTATNNYVLTKGWNMLYTSSDKTLATLSLSLNGSTQTAQQLISANLIHNKIFIIADDSATTACQYFTVLGNSAVSADCANNSLATNTTIPAGKAFWVYVK